MSGSTNGTVRPGYPSREPGGHGDHAAGSWSPEAGFDAFGRSTDPYADIPRSAAGTYVPAAERDADRVRTVAAPPQPVWHFREFAAGLKHFGIPKVPFTEGMAGVPEVVMDGRKLINFAPVNFLNLHSRPDVMDVFTSSAHEFGLATGGARISQGVTRPHMDMEAELCRILGKDRAISYATGMVANIGFVHAMSNKQVWSEDMQIDHTDVVFVYDRDNHWSLWKAAEKLEYGKTLFSFKHNNAADLDRVLSRLRGKRIIVVFESVYSVDGSVAPMHDIVDVCEKYGALSYVDDANGFLVYGPSHRPFAQEYAGMMRSTFIMVSLKKAVGLEGGMIVGPDDAIFAMEALGMASVFTAQVQPPTAATAAYTMRLLTVDEPQIMDNYLRKVADFRELLIDEGFDLNPTPSIMTSIDVGAESTGMALREAFLERGYRIPVYLFPAARRNHATMRLILNATHTDEHIEGFVDLMREFRTEFFPGSTVGRHRLGRNGQPARDATTRWVGGMRDGRGQISLDASNAGLLGMSYRSRRSSKPEGQTSPEELMAAAHSSCLAMHLSGVLEAEGYTAESIDVSSDVTMARKDGVRAIAGIEVTLRARVPGVDSDRFADLAEEATRTCPISVALSGLPITVDAALADATAGQPA